MYLPMLTDEQLAYAARCQSPLMQTGMEEELSRRLDAANDRIAELEAALDDAREEALEDANRRIVELETALDKAHERVGALESYNERG